MNETIFNLLKEKPLEYQLGEEKFWDDEHISKCMLEAHLNPDLEAASRKHDFIKKSAKWISDIAAPTEEKKLLDLGCGPGIYTEHFDELGFVVTGVDFSKRSIDYARESAKIRDKNIVYYYGDYRLISFDNEFDVVTMIYCDYGVLSPKDRACVLSNVLRALKPCGILILDAWTLKQYQEFRDSQSVSYENDGFWKNIPYSCIQRNFRYEDTRTFLEQYIIITENQNNCYNNWNCAFDEEELYAELRKSGFNRIELYGDVGGSAYNENSNTICAVARK